MPASSALIGYGSTFAIADDSSPDLYVELAEVSNILPPSVNMNIIDVSHMKSADRRREFISGLMDASLCKVQMNYVPGSTSDLRLNELLELPIGTTRQRSCRILFPNGQAITFDAILQAYELDNLSVDDKLTASATFRVSSGEAAPVSVIPDNLELRVDGGYELRSDGGFELRG